MKFFNGIQQYGYCGLLIVIMSGATVSMHANKIIVENTVPERLHVEMDALWDGRNHPVAGEYLDAATAGNFPTITLEQKPYVVAGLWITGELGRFYFKAPINILSVKVQVRIPKKYAAHYKKLKYLEGLADKVHELSLTNYKAADDLHAHAALEYKILFGGEDLGDYLGKIEDLRSSMSYEIVGY